MSLYCARDTLETRYGYQYGLIYPVPAGTVLDLQTDCGNDQTSTQRQRAIYPTLQYNRLMGPSTFKQT